MGNLLLRIGFALSIVGAAIGMTAAASDTVARCDATLAVSASDGTASCAPVGNVEPAVAGYQAAPITADRAPMTATAPNGAVILVGLATGERLPTIAWGVADASGEATVDALVDAADRAMYRQKQLARKRTTA